MSRRIELIPSDSIVSIRVTVTQDRITIKFPELPNYIKPWYDYALYVNEYVDYANSLRGRIRQNSKSRLQLRDNADKVVYNIVVPDELLGIKERYAD